MTSHARQVMTSSTDSLEKEEWGTPKPLFDQLSSRYGYELDLAASSANTKCQRFLTRRSDSLAIDWSPEQLGASRLWLNPPYGRSLPSWIVKARESAQAWRILVTLLLPARPETDYWHRSIWAPAGRLAFSGYDWRDPLGVRLVLDSSELGLEIIFLRGRVSFEVPGKASDPAPFPSALVTFSHPSLTRRGE